VTQEEALELARDLYQGNPAAAPLLIQMVHGDPAESARAKAALKVLVPGADQWMKELPRAPKTRMLWQGIKAAVAALDRYDVGDFTGFLSTGLLKLDRRLRGGLLGGRMYLLGAPSGGGKTSFVHQLVSSAAETGPVLFITPEMSLESIARREIVRTSRTPEWDRNPWIVDRIRKSSAQAAHAAAASQILQQKRPIYMLDMTDVTMTEVEEAAKMIPKLGLVVIDYAQYVADEASNTPRYLQVGAVATRSVALSIRQGIPVLVSSQVNVTKGAGGRREYSFRETQKLQHSADTVLIFDVQWGEDENSGLRTVEESWFICEKQRDGPTFRLKVDYDPELYLIRDHDAPRTFGRGLLPPANVED
jgi:replicative DNA helicase